MKLYTIFVLILLLNSVESHDIPPKIQTEIDRILGGQNLANVTVWVIPHSHDDVGFKETAKQYYDDKVHAMMNTIVEALTGHSERKFNLVEMYFLHRWWDDPVTTDEQRQAMKTLIQNGQIEIVNGGWVMQDEGVTDYTADVDQMTLGHLWVKNIFDAIPRHGWHIDPFGASSATPTMFADMGFNSFTISRIPEWEQTKMADSKSLEFVWSGSPTLREKASIFTHDIDKFGYSSDLRFDNPDCPAVDELTAWGYTLDVLYHVEEKAKWAATSNLMFTWGGDFEFYGANKMFDNMDKLISYINVKHSDLNMHLKYCTVNEYFAALNALNVTWPVRGDDDFFPLQDGGLDEQMQHRFWTGYYTSRPLLKGESRRNTNTLNSIEKIYSIARATKATTGPTFNYRIAYDKVDVLRQAVASVQHHDAITGTSWGYIQADYLNMLTTGESEAYEVTSQTLAGLCGKAGNAPTITFDESLIENIGVGEMVPVVVFNPLGWTQSTFVTMKTHAVAVNVSRSDSFELVPSFDSAVPNQLFVHVVVPPMGFTTVFVTGVEGDEVSNGVPTTEGSIENGVYYVNVTNGHIGAIVIKSDMTHIKLQDSLMFYKSKSGIEGYDDPWRLRTEGDPVEYTGGSSVIFSGDVVQILHVGYSNGFSETIRLFRCNGCDAEEYIEVIPTVGPLEMDTDVMIKFKTDLNTQGVFYTDDNGKQYQKRVYNSKTADTVAGNYYPTVYSSYVEEESTGIQMTLVVDRSHGLSSQKNGEMELMLHRRTKYHSSSDFLKDDDSIVSPVIRLIMLKNSTSTRHREALILNFAPILAYATGVQSIQSYTANYMLQKQYLEFELPPNIHLMTFAPLNGDDQSVILRFVHLYEENESPEMSHPVNIDLDALLSVFLGPITVDERSLNVVWRKADLTRWHWKTERAVESSVFNEDISSFTIYPAETKTFLVSY